LELFLGVCLSIGLEFFVDTQVPWDVCRRLDNICRHPHFKIYYNIFSSLLSKQLASILKQSYNRSIRKVQQSMRL